MSEDDLNEMAKRHSAGATVNHSSPFNHLPIHKNETQLSVDFLHKWVVPFYMTIGSINDNNWIEEIKQIKTEISPSICLSLLGDFNWRTRLVGAYFSAIKSYENFIDIIGVHLLKSEVCCVGHIYALTLAFFNTEKSVAFLNKYLDYYLTMPTLYFDQKSVMEAILYLDKTNGSTNFKRHLISWETLEQNRKTIEKQSALRVAKLLEEEKGKSIADEYLHALSINLNRNAENFTTDYFEKQIFILLELNQHNS
ncbi:MAG: DUF6000 family protein [Agriterribacter sp.]